MIKNSLLLTLALLASACSNGSNPEQERITLLEQENAQLRADLEQAKGDVKRLHSLLAHGDSGMDEGEIAPAGPVIPQGIDPQPGGSVNGPANIE